MSYEYFYLFRDLKKYVCIYFKETGFERVFILDSSNHICVSVCVVGKVYTEIDYLGLMLLPWDRIMINVPRRASIKLTFDGD